jgi:1-deoxy-D-xylulose-5-phosphate reductoisomerase
VKQIALLGSTGSIGKQALEVVKNNPERFKIVVLSANNNFEKLIEQAIEFEPKAVVIGCKNSYLPVKSALKGKNIEVHQGTDNLNAVVERDDVDIVLVALVGFAGLKPVINAIKAGKNVALANKESLVVAGQMLTNLAKKHQVKILPVDSEHSAIYQCLIGEQTESIEKIYLTASGGPFLGKSRDFLKDVSAKQALQHPKWEMGQKITIDSASLMNKGLEVIEARWLFDVNAGQIEVLIHPQSIVHSMVQFVDGSIKAQMGQPDMRLPIQFALSYPERIFNPFPRFDFSVQPQLTFSQPDKETFRNLELAYEALSKSGNMPCILNAANEVAVNSFLNGTIKFLQITEMIEHCMDKIVYIETPDLEDLILTNRETKAVAQHLVKQLFSTN